MKFENKEWNYQAFDYIVTAFVLNPFERMCKYSK